MAEWDADVDVSQERAARWIAARFPDLSGLAIEPVGWGFDNAVFRVGPELVFRIPRRKMGDELLRAEISVLPHLAPRLPVPIPSPVLVGEPGADYPYRFAAYPWLEGTTADRQDPTDARRAALAPDLGRFLAALHGLDPPDAPDIEDTMRRHDMVHRLPRLLDVLAAEVPGKWHAPAREALEELVRTEPWDGRPRWVHGDLYARHLLLDDRARLVGVIDWGDCHRGDVAIDLSIAWTFLPAEAFSAFRAAYGEISEAVWRRAQFRALHYGIHLLRFGLAEDDEAMARAGHRALIAATA